MNRRAFTLVELLIVILLIAVLLAILIPSLDRAREEIRRGRCRANLHGIATALTAYAGEQNWKDRFPDCGRPNNTGPINTTGSMWILVVTGKLESKVFVCPTEESEARAEAYDGGIEASTTPFPKSSRGRLTCSYSYQVPHCSGTGESTLTNNPGLAEKGNQTRFVVMADRSPFDSPPPANSSLSGKLLSACATWAAFYAATASNPTGENLNNYISRNGRYKFGATSVTCLTDAERRLVNSRNHRGEGQNVLYRDGHVEWKATPLAGVNFDNIYTRATGTGSAKVTDRAVGSTPDTTSLPYDADDSYLRTYPLP